MSNTRRTNQHHCPYEFWTRVSLLTSYRVHSQRDPNEFFDDADNYLQLNVMLILRYPYLVVFYNTRVTVNSFTNQVISIRNKTRRYLQLRKGIMIIEISNSYKK